MREGLKLEKQVRKVLHNPGLRGALVHDSDKRN